MQLGIRAPFLAAVLAVAPAFSATVTYVDRSLWETDVTTFKSVTFEDFNETPNFGGPGVVVYDGSTSASAEDCGSLNSGQACFQNIGVSYTWSVVNGQSPAPTDHTHFRLTAAAGQLQITVGPDTNSFGMDFYSVSLANRPVSVTLYADLAGSTVLGTYNDIDPGFFGVVSDDSIAMIRLSSGGFSEIYLDTFDFAGVTGSGGNGEEENPAETPEATSLAYMGLGLLTIWVGTRRRESAAAATPAH